MVATEQPGLGLDFLIREPADVYHGKAVSNLSSHQLADFRHCPAIYRQKKLGVIRDTDNDAFAMGRAAHTLILEGREQYDAEYAIGGPVNEKTGNPYGEKTKAFAEYREQIGKPILSDSQAALIEMMAIAVSEHEHAQLLLGGGVAEGVIRCDYLEHACQARLDWLNPDPQYGLVDLKTCENLDTFEADFHRFGYVNQIAFYLSLIHAATGMRVRAHVVAVETHRSSPWNAGFHRCGVWAIGSTALSAAANQNARAMERLRGCIDTNTWPTLFESPRLMQHRAN